MRDGRDEQDGTPREIYEEPKTCLLPGLLAKSICLTPLSSNVSTSSAYAPTLKAANVISTLTSPLNRGKTACSAAPEDLRVEEINDDNHAEGLIGYVRERNYKGMTLESVVELENGKMVMVSEFFNEDDPDFDHSLDQNGH